jgi:hypothetical protein
VLHVRRLTRWQSVPRYNICNGLACFCRPETALLVLPSCTVACSCIDLQGSPQTLTCNGCSVLTDCLHVTDTDSVSKLFACRVEERVPLFERLHHCYSFGGRTCATVGTFASLLLFLWKNMCHCWNVYITATLFCGRRCATFGTLTLLLLCFGGRTCATVRTFTSLLLFLVEERVSPLERLPRCYSLLVEECVPPLELLDRCYSLLVEEHVPLLERLPHCSPLLLELQGIYMWLM